MPNGLLKPFPANQLQVMVQTGAKGGIVSLNADTNSKRTKMLSPSLRVPARRNVFLENQTTTRPVLMQFFVLITCTRFMGTFIPFTGQLHADVVFTGSDRARR